MIECESFNVSSRKQYTNLKKKITKEKEITVLTKLLWWVVDEYKKKITKIKYYSFCGSEQCPERSTDAFLCA